MKKSGRPKGTKQARNESKYWLPEGIKLKPGQTQDYNKSTKLIFIDAEYGEFTSYFQAIQSANMSVHPEAVKARRAQTNLQRYGNKTNLKPNGSVEFKAQMNAKYGADNPHANPEIRSKYEQTMIEKYGAASPLSSEIIKNKITKTNIERYGTDIPMKSLEIQEKVIKTNREKYGVDNYAKTPECKEKFLKTISKEDSFKSEGELQVKAYIESLGFKCETGYIGGKDPKQLDIKVLDTNIAIEFNGCYWHSEDFGRNTTYHLNKTRACEAKGLKLLQIFDTEWETRQEQVKSFLKSTLGKNEIKLNARDCEIKEVSKMEGELFLDKYHILGSTRFKIGYGLFYKDELVTLMTFNAHHRNNKELVLNRLVTKTNITVRGGLSKLSKHAYNNLGQFVTWVDRRWSNAQGWISCGYIQGKILPPDYFYFNKKNRKVVSKQSRQKRLVGTPKDMTESEHAKIDGLMKIWDCGKIKLIYKGE